MSDFNQVVFPRKLLKKFILLYKELNCLWDRETPDYRIKMKKQAALTKLTDLVQEYDPNATRVHVLRKIDSLRACVRREYKRVLESRLHATCEDEVYKPNLWYFDLLSFVFKKAEIDAAPILGGNTRGTSVESEAEEEEDDDDEPSEEETNDQSDHNETYVTDNYPSEYNIPLNVVDFNDRVSSIKKCQSSEDSETFKTKRSKTSTEVDDEYDAIGINVAAKLRYLPANMRILAEKLINDVLFQAQINSLNSSTKIVTMDPFKQESGSSTS